jgi:hypothetical protein
MTSTPNSSEIFGPFSPPADYRFEPELCALPPRSIPDSILGGFYEKQRRRALWLTFVLGMGCLVVWSLPVWRQWAQRFSPLQYLAFVGVALLGLWAWHVARRFFALGAYRYLQDGVPLIARVVELVKAPIMRYNGEPVGYAFTALIEFLDPETKDLRTATVQSRGITSPDQYTTSFRVGDYVTAVFLPRNPTKSLRLYAFLDLAPNQGLVRSAPSPKRRRWSQRVLTALGVAALLAVLFSNPFAFASYLLIDRPFSMLWPMVLGAIVLGGGLVAGAIWQDRRKVRRREEVNRTAMIRGEALHVGHFGMWDRPGVGGLGTRGIVVVGGLLFGGLTGLCWAMSLNAILDDSPPQWKLVIVKGAFVETDAGVFKRYHIEYSLPGSDEVHDFNSYTKDLGDVAIGPAMAEVHAGRFGWRWVKVIRPLLPNRGGARPIEWRPGPNGIELILRERFL